MVVLLVVVLVVLLAVEWYRDWVGMEREKRSQARIHMDTKHWWANWHHDWVTMEREKRSQARVQCTRNAGGSKMVVVAVIAVFG